MSSITERWQNLPLWGRSIFLIGIPIIGGIVIAAIAELLVVGSFSFALFLIGGVISTIGFLYSFGQTCGVIPNVRASYIRPSYDKTVLHDARRRYLNDSMVLLVPGICLVILSFIFAFIEMGLGGLVG